ncbi:class I histocompatibility antigen, F10 alpha chain-like [Discoglossus pictus]
MHQLLLILIVGMTGVYCDSHSYRYFHTAVSDPGGGLSLFTAVGYVDEYEVGVYTSDTREFHVRTKWIKEKVDPALWERATPIYQGNEPVYKHNVKTLMSRFNQSGGFHIVQVMYGCELDDDGTTRGYNQHGYDGRDFLSLDKDRVIWVPVVNEAQITTERWNSPEVGNAERRKNYLEEECIDWLRKYIRAGREELERRVTPTVKISHHQAGELTRLHCQVYGFYPRDVDVKWVKNGIDDVYSEEAKQILPNPDGTYQTRVTVEVTPKKGDSYSCHVDHKSLGEPMMILWDPPKNNPVYIIIGVLAALVIAAGIGFFVYMKISGKKSPVYTPAARK